MIDFHNHILPNVDDGSKSYEMSIDMIKEASKQGITDIINTVHFQHPKIKSNNIDYNNISLIRDKLDSKLKEIDVNVKIHLGAEVFFDYNLVELISNRLVTFSNYSYMLIEFNISHFPKDYEVVLFDLVKNGVTPIIAHPERYREIQLDINILQKLIHSGCLIQVDAGSLIGKFGKNCKKTSIKIFEMNMAHFIGSDAHDDKKRNFCLKSAVKSIKHLIGDKEEILLSENPLKLIKGERVEPFEISNNEKTNFLSKIKKRLNL